MTIEAQAAARQRKDGLEQAMPEAPMKLALNSVVGHLAFISK